jgi:RNA-directed DNA polymerase
MPVTTKLKRFTLKAREEPRTRFTALMGILWDPDGLRESFGRQDGRKAPGVDGVTKADYAEGVQSRLTELSARIRRMGYQPQPARRTYIPKGDGRMRPLGVPAFEDRLVQDRLSLILQAIWEPEFRNCSYGFRPGRGAHDALRRVAEVITNERTQWVVEADIKGFFDHVSHVHLLRFLEHRIGDPNLLRTIRRFLKAGIMEDGVHTAGVEGTPQGGLVSPVLSNIYLHYVLDLWFEKRFARGCAGKAYLIRYNERLRALRVQGGNAMVAFLVRHLNGHIQYYGVSGNSRWLSSYVHCAQRMLFNWLNRRSQKRSFNWKQFADHIRPWLPRARIVHDLYPVPWWKTQTGSRMV